MYIGEWRWAGEGLGGLKMVEEGYKREEGRRVEY